MTATTEVHAPLLGEAGEPCRECGAPLAADQRYCLNCGARRGEARVDHTAYTRETVSATAPAPAPPSRGGGATVVAGVATLLLALGIGVLIGRAGRDTAPQKASAPQVIKVTGGAAVAPAATTPSAPATPSKVSKSTKHGASGTGASAVKGHSKATNPSLTKLQSSSGKDYSKQSQKLPKTLSTGGKPPPKDHKPAGGGSGFQSIG